MPFLSYPARAAMVVAHPSHELRLHGWLEKARPYVCVLTDGAGRSGESRLRQTSEVLANAGARQGAIYGRLTDAQVYSAILDGNAELFARLVAELAQVFVDEQIEYVVGDAAEGYNVTHDICRPIIGAAVNVAEQEYGHRVANFDFLVVGPPAECPDELRDRAMWLQLDDQAFERKVQAVLDYSPALATDVEAARNGAPFRGVGRMSEPQLAGEVDVEVNVKLLEALDSRPRLKAQFRDMIDGVPLDAFRVECLRPAGNSSETQWTSSDPPFFEVYGEKLVAAGRYQKVIRYEQHMRPLTQAIRERVERKERCVGSAF